MLKVVTNFFYFNVILTWLEECVIFPYCCCVYTIPNKMQIIKCISYCSNRGAKIGSLLLPFVALSGPHLSRLSLLSCAHSLLFLWLCKYIPVIHLLFYLGNLGRLPQGCCIPWVHIPFLPLLDPIRSAWLGVEEVHSKKTELSLVLRCYWGSYVFPHVAQQDCKSWRYLFWGSLLWRIQVVFPKLLWRCAPAHTSPWLWSTLWRCLRCGAKS